MAALLEPTITRSPEYHGLRLSGEDYFRLEDDGYKYELVHGTMVMSPSALPSHQWVVVEIMRQLLAFVEKSPVGRILTETDVQFEKDLVYRPEIIFLRTERAAGQSKRICVVPDLVVEVISPSSRRYDRETKRTDYERFGVMEYWLIDPDEQSMQFLRHDGTRFVEAVASKDVFASQAVPGFILEMARVREAFKPW